MEQLKINVGLEGLIVHLSLRIKSISLKTADFFIRIISVATRSVKVGSGATISDRSSKTWKKKNVTGEGMDRSIAIYSFTGSSL